MSRFDIQTNVRTDDIDAEYPKLVCRVKQETDPQEPCEKYGFSPILNRYRNAIDNIEPNDWKKVRWYINEYDFLVKDPIINRAFYKYWEIINEFELFEEYKDDHLILHCAEAPGGFIQGTNIYLQMDGFSDRIQETDNIQEDGWMKVGARKKKSKKDYMVFTISLNKDLPQYKSYNLPSYNKNILNQHICITYGKDHTGDINNWENIRHIENLSSKKFFFITADGGFDEGTDFNNKEQLHYGLILSEVYAAIELQTQGGHFVLKVFDVFTTTSVHMLYMLSLCYDEMYAYKPKTSRPTNSEKYIVCKNFTLTDKMRHYFTKNLRTLSNVLKKGRTKYSSFTLFDHIPVEFQEKMCNMNVKLLGKQCDFLERAVKLCADINFLEHYDTNLSNSLERRRRVFHEWQEQYNLTAYV